MEKDSQGFLYPVVDEDKCVDCGICQGVCRIDSHKYKKDFICSKYGRAVNEYYVRNGSSGGAFLSVVSAVNPKKENVFGAAFFPESKSVEITSAAKVPLLRLTKSKYVDSYTGDSYKEVKKLLLAGETVVYSAAPCQVDGLLHFLDGTPDDNLVTVDFICHGMPSQKYFEDHLRHIEKNKNSCVKDVNFRPKTLGWTCMSVIYTFQNEKQTERAALADSYFKGFLDDLYLRESCYSCEYRQRHAADITIADFWSYIYLRDKVTNDEKGLSLLIANSTKGRKILDELSVNHMTLHDVDNGFVKKYVLKAKSGTDSLLNKREEFKKLVAETGFENAAKKYYMKSSKLNQIKFLVKKYLIRKKIW